MWNLLFFYLGVLIYKIKFIENNRCVKNKYMCIYFYIHTHDLLLIKLYFFTVYYGYDL